MVELLHGVLYERVQARDQLPQRYSGQMGSTEIPPVQAESIQGSDVVKALGGACTGIAVPREAGSIAIGSMTRAV